MDEYGKDIISMEEQLNSCGVAHIDSKDTSKEKNENFALDRQLVLQLIQQDNTRRLTMNP